jgi:hypothetical protein
MTEVDDNFSSSGAALDTALSLDGSVKTFAFSDGSGRPPNVSGAGKIFVALRCLWNIRNENLIVRTHSHGTNYVLQNNQITTVFHASDVPDNARIAANAYVDVDDVQYRVDRAELENGLYILDLQVFRSR